MSAPANAQRLSAALIAGILALLLGAGIVISAFAGSSYSFAEVGAWFVQKIPGIGPSLFPGLLPNNIDAAMNLRIPRILLSLIVGAGLSWAGAVFQSLFRNPLADPYFLGVSSGASFGTVLALVIFPGMAGIFRFSLSSLFAFVFSLGTVFLVYALSRSRGRASLANMVLSGIAVSAVLTALVSVLMMIARNRLEQIVLATMGSFANAAFEDLAVTVPVVLAGILVSLFFARDLNLLLFGDEHATGLGVDVERRKRFLLVLASLVGAVCTAASGIIWFVGLVVPHLVRLVAGPDNRRLLPLSALAGALLLVIADTLARSLFAHEIPIGILTALSGGPFFIYLLQKSKKSHG